MKLTPHRYSWPAIRCPSQICESSKHWQGYCRKCLTVKDKTNGAPEVTILDLFLGNLCQVCHRLRSVGHLMKDPTRVIYGDSEPIQEVVTDNPING
jgi:hypothetical protein